MGRPEAQFFLETPVLNSCFWKIRHVLNVSNTFAMTMIVCISGYLRNISFFFCSINIVDTMVPELIWALENCHFTDAQCFVVLIIFRLTDVRFVTSIGDQIANMNRPICLFTFLKSCIKLENLQSAN